LNLLNRLVIENLSGILEFCEIQCPPFVIDDFEFFELPMNLRAINASENHIAFLSNVLPIIVA
jgi:hypothetical protein